MATREEMRVFNAILRAAMQEEDASLLSDGEWTPTQRSKKQKAVVSSDAGEVLATCVLQAQPRVIDESRRIIKHRINTPAVDTYGTRVLPSGANLTNWAKNPTVLHNHNPDQEIGRGLRFLRTDDYIDVEWQMFSSKNPDALVEELWERTLQGGNRGSSVGFLIVGDGLKMVPPDEAVSEDHWADITAWDMREFSVTPIPSNPEALQRAAAMVRYESLLRSVRGDTKVWVPVGIDLKTLVTTSEVSPNTTKIELERTDMAEQTPTVSTPAPEQREEGQVTDRLAGIETDLRKSVDELREIVKGMKPAEKAVDQVPVSQELAAKVTQLETELNTKAQALEQANAKLTALQGEYDKLQADFDLLAETAKKL